MKKHVKYLVLITMLLVLSFSCENKNALSDKSVIVDRPVVDTDFDKWLKANYLDGYNIEVKYRLEDKESAMNYNLVPADHAKSVQLSKLVLYLCLQAYDEVTGSREFMRSYFPKVLNFVGSGAYNNNGTYILGTAEGGKKINLFDVNNMNPENAADLNKRYFNTMHHEFSHILHQNKPYSPNFKEITASLYVGDSWNSKYKSVVESRKDGFISPYSSKDSDEDFVELISHYVISSPAAWKMYIMQGNSLVDDKGNSLLIDADGKPIENPKLTKGGNIIMSKFEIVKSYLLNTWKIDIEKLRDEVQKRQKFVEENGIDKLPV